MPMGMCAVHHFEDLSHQTGAINGIAGTGGDEFDVEFRASQQEGKGPNIIDIVTDVGIQNRGYCHVPMLLSCRGLLLKEYERSHDNIFGSARLRARCGRCSQSERTSAKPSRL